MTRPPPVRIVLFDDYEIVVAGVTAALEPYSDRVRVIELDPADPAWSEVDIVLHDTFGRAGRRPAELAPPPSEGGPRVVVFSWNLHPGLVALAMDRGAAGYVAKSLTAAEIVTALERVRAGERVRALGREPVVQPASLSRESGLSPREAEVLALIARGFSNQEIARRCFVSVNSVKTYIRSAYRKIGVSRRSQAVAWGIDQGLEVDHLGLGPVRDDAARGE